LKMNSCKQKQNRKNGCLHTGWKIRIQSLIYHNCHYYQIKTYVLMNFEIYVELNEHILYRDIKKRKQKRKKACVTSSASGSAGSTVLCICMNILTKIFQDLNIDSDMLDANESYFVTIYLIELSASNVQA